MRAEAVGGWTAANRWSNSIELVREPALGRLSWNLLISMVYLITFGSIAMYVATRRMTPSDAALTSIGVGAEGCLDYR